MGPHLLRFSTMPSVPALGSSRLALSPVNVWIIAGKMKTSYLGHILCRRQ